MSNVRHREADAHAAGRYQAEKAARAKAESALEASEKQLRMLVQGVVDYAIFMLDPQGLIVERRGGRIWLESAPGEGTTCYFTLAAEAS